MKSKILHASLIGNSNSGKSTLLNSIVNKKISITNKKRNTTIDSIVGILSIGNIQVLIHDTPGLIFIKSELKNNKKIKINLINSITISNIVFYILDVSKKNVDLDKDIFYQLKKDKKKIFIILNKIDLVNKVKLLPIINNISKKYKTNEVLLISAKFNFGIEDMFSIFKKNAYYGKWLYKKNEKTDKSELFISEEITRNSLLRNLNDEIPYSLRVINSKWKNIDKNNLVIHQDIVIKKDRYKKIILGKKGLMIKKIREYSQKKLSLFFEKKIHLYLEVKLIK